MKDLFAIMPEFLRDPDAFFQSIQEEKDVKDKALTLFLVSVFSFMVYGFMVGLAKSRCRLFLQRLRFRFCFYRPWLSACRRCISFHWLCCALP